MLELLGLVALIVILGAVAVACLKVLFWLLVLPFKLGWWLLNGVFALVVIVPLVVLSVLVATAAIPVVILVAATPVLIVVGGLIVLVRLIA